MPSPTSSASATETAPVSPAPLWVAGLIDSCTTGASTTCHPRTGLRELLRELLHGGAQLLTAAPDAGGAPDPDRPALATTLQLDGNVLVRVNATALADDDWPAAYAVHRAAVEAAGARLATLGRHVATALAALRGLALVGVPTLGSGMPLGAPLAEHASRWLGTVPDAAPLLATLLHVLGQAIGPMALGYALAAMLGRTLLRAALHIAIRRP